MALHRDHKSSRPLSKDYEYIGLVGEKTLADYLGLQIDTVLRPTGDGGVDLVCGHFRLDVKTARKPYNLIVERGKAFPNTIYVLAKYYDDGDRATLIGWEFGEAVRSAPCKDFGYGIINHYIPAGDLRPMPELLQTLKNESPKR